MNRLVIAVLFLAIAGACTLLGCQSDQKAIEQAIADLELTSSGEVKHPRSVLAIVSKDPDDVVAAVEHLYTAIPGLRVRAAATLAFLAGQSDASALKARMGRLAEQMLFDKDPIVAKKGLNVLLSVRHPSVENLVTRRLLQPCDKVTIEDMVITLAMRGMHNVIRDEISLAPPENNERGATENWLNHVNAGVLGCKILAVRDHHQLPADFGPRLVLLMTKNESISWSVVDVLAKARPEGAIPAIKVELGKTTTLRTRVALEIALLILDSENPALPEAALGQLKDVARRFRSMPECWSEVVMRTKWLALASVYRTDDDLLRGMWGAIDGVSLRDKADLLAMVVSQYIGSFSSERASTNRLILFLDALPGVEFRRMSGLQPDLQFYTTELVTESAQAALPNLITRDAMDAAAQRLVEKIK